MTIGARECEVPLGLVDRPLDALTTLMNEPELERRHARVLPDGPLEETNDLAHVPSDSLALTETVRQVQQGLVIAPADERAYVRRPSGGTR